MKLILFRILGRASDFADVQPLPALFLGGALLAVFLTALFRGKSDPTPSPSLLWTLYHQAGRLIWAFLLVSFLMWGLATLRSYLHQTVANFQRSHGRITQANYDAVQTIWGAEQTQGELRLDLYYEEETTERIESEILTKPAIIRKKTVRHNITSNPFISAHHDVTLRQNPRKKGSALYGGYETKCDFTWRVKNPTNRELNSDIRFPLPANGAMYDDLSATLSGQDVLPQMQIKEAALVLSRPLQPDEVLDLHISFKSRGMSYWYMQVREAREIRDFTLSLNLPDLPQARLNYPEGCMTPTDIKPTPDGQGSLLAYRLDHALSNKGMGISLPALPQPGATTRAVLGAVEPSWLLIFALLVLGLTLASARHAVLISLLFGAGTAMGYGLMGDFSDLLLGFWGTSVFILLPILLLLGHFLGKVVPGATGRCMAWLFLFYGILLPLLAGVDDERQSLYLNIAAGSLLAFVTWQFVSLWRIEPPPVAAPAPA